MKRMRVAFELQPYLYSRSIEGRLRALVRDRETPDEVRRHAIDVLKSWRIVLDPAIYPLAGTARVAQCGRTVGGAR